MGNHKPFSTPYFTVKPANAPQMIKMHAEFRNGEWKEEPGTLAVIIGTLNKEDIDELVMKIFSRLFRKIKTGLYSDLVKKLHDCEHKLHAVRYHRLVIEKEIDTKVKEFQEKYNAGAGVSFEKQNHILIYETEAYLFQVKSSLDLIVQALAKLYPSLKSFRTFRHSGTPGESNYIAGGKFISLLSKSGQKELHDVFEQNRTEWIQEMTVWRDTITHFSKLEGFFCFVEEPFTGGEVKIHYPSMPNGKMLTEYVDEIYDKLIKLYDNVFKIIDNNFDFQ